MSRWLPARLSITSLDILVIVLLLAGGLYGNHEFPEFLSSSEAMGRPHANIGTAFFAAFNLLVTYRAVSPAYFSCVRAWIAAVSLDLLLIAITVALLILIKGWPGANGVSPVALVAAMGDSVLLLSIQGSLKPVADFRAMNKLRDEVIALAKTIKGSNPKQEPNDETVKEMRRKLERLRAVLTSAAAEDVLESRTRAAIEGILAEIPDILTALKAPNPVAVGLSMRSVDQSRLENPRW